MDGKESEQTKFDFQNNFIETPKKYSNMLINIMAACTALSNDKEQNEEELKLGKLELQNELLEFERTMNEEIDNYNKASLKFNLISLSKLKSMGQELNSKRSVTNSEIITQIANVFSK